jgi:hypothetical protein
VAHLYARYSCRNFTKQLRFDVCLATVHDFDSRKLNGFNLEAFRSTEVKRRGKQLGHLKLWTTCVVPMHVRGCDLSRWTSRLIACGAGCHPKGFARWR